MTATPATQEKKEIENLIKAAVAGAITANKVRILMMHPIEIGKDSAVIDGLKLGGLFGRIQMAFFEQAQLCLAKIIDNDSTKEQYSIYGLFRLLKEITAVRTIEPMKDCLLRLGVDNSLVKTESEKSTEDFIDFFIKRVKGFLNANHGKTIEKSRQIRNTILAHPDLNAPNDGIIIAECEALAAFLRDIYLAVCATLEPTMDVSKGDYAYAKAEIKRLSKIMNAAATG